MDRRKRIKAYTLSADDIRLLYQSPVLQADGREGISADMDNAVWKALFRILNIRMQNGDFTDIPIEEVKIFII